MNGPVPSQQDQSTLSQKRQLGQTPKRRLLGVLGVVAFVGGFYGGARIEESNGFAELSTFLAIYVVVWMWLRRDHSRFPGVAGQYGGMGFYLLWPVLIPFYMVQTRGLRAASRILALVTLVWIAATLAGYLAGMLLAG